MEPFSNSARSLAQSPLLFGSSFIFCFSRFLKMLGGWPRELCFFVVCSQLLPTAHTEIGFFFRLFPDRDVAPRRYSASPARLTHRPVVSPFFFLSHRGFPIRAVQEVSGRFWSAMVGLCAGKRRKRRRREIRAYKLGGEQIAKIHP